MCHRTSHPVFPIPNPLPYLRYPIPPIFTLMQKKGGIEDKMMYNTYNMGLGMVLAVAKEDVAKVIAAVEAAGEKAYEVGYIESGDKGVSLC